MANWNCDNCDRELRADDPMIGTFMRCPYCEHPQRVPGGRVLSVTLDPEPEPPPARDPRRSRRPAARPPIRLDDEPGRIVITDEDLRHVRLPQRAATASPPSVSVQRRRSTKALENPRTVRADTPLDEDKCPYCLCEFEPRQTVVLCPECRMPHHADCWGENEGCTQFGCAMAPLRSSVGPPVVEPGRTRAPRRYRCNRCGRFMPVGSDRCPQCDGAARRRPSGPVRLPSQQQAIGVANGGLGRAIFALVWVIFMMQIALNAISPASGAQVAALLFMLAPGFIVAISAIRKASNAINALRESDSVVGRGRAVFAILLAVATLVICVGTLLVALDRAQHV